MGNERTTYSVAWMPSLLRLCMDIQTHAKSLHEAKTRLEERLGQIETDFEKALTLDRQINLAKDEVGERQSEADREEIRYSTYREGIMSRMMDAARAGESIDREEAGRLVELEISRNLGIEKLKQATLRLEELVSQRESFDTDISTALANCDEIQNLYRSYEEATDHLRNIDQALEELSIEKALVDNQTPENALSKFSMLIESYSTWASSIGSGESTGEALAIQRQYLGRVLDIYTIDSTTLFSEICITLASRPLTTRLMIPDQEPFSGDLADY